MMKLRLLFLLISGLGLPFSCHCFSAQSSFVARPNERLLLVVKTPPSSQSSSTSSSLWSMHMGHSHAHHHHHGHSHSHDHGGSSTATPLKRPTTVRRKISLVVFAACVVLVPQYVMKRYITRAHGATFALTCIALTMLNQIRSGFASIVEKVRVSSCCCTTSFMACCSTRMIRPSCML